jgi:TolB-like protein
MSTNSTLIEELKRRNIIRVATVYAVACWVLLQLADIIFPVLGLADEDIRYVIFVLVAGFPAIIAFSWLFEVTPDGLRLTRQVDKGESISHETARRIDFIIIILLSVALTFFAYEYFTRDEAVVVPQVIETIEKPQPVVTTDTRPSIAVLPFVNMSSDSENEYFSDGLSEELLNVLAQIQELRVAGRTSSFYYKDKSETLQTIGSALNVNNILEGSVRKSGNKIRITAQLISADDGFHLWSRTFDREVTDIFAIQDEISREVATAMKVTLLTDGIDLPESRLTANPEAHDLYLRAKDALYQRDEESVRTAIDLFRQSSTLDPEYAPPLLGLADASLILQNNNRTVSIPESADIAETALDKAASLGYQTSDYWATLGLNHHHLANYDNKHYAEAVNAYQQSLALNENNVNAYIWYSSLLGSDTSWNNDAQARTLLEKALSLDPLNRVANQNYQLQLSRAGRDNEAISNLKRLIKLDPGYPAYAQTLGLIHFSKARYLEAARQLKRIPRTEFVHAILGYIVLVALGEEDMLGSFFDHIPQENPSADTMRLAELGLRATDAEVIAEARVLLLQPDYEGDGRFVVNRLNEAGEYRLARAILENVSISLKDDLDRVQGNNRGILTEYLAALHYTGEAERAGKLAHIILENNKSAPPTGNGNRGIRNAVCYLVLGQTDQAIEAIEEAYQGGWRFYYGARLDHLPVFKPIIGNPRIKKVKQDIDQYLDEQRPLVLKEMREAGVFTTRI